MFKEIFSPNQLKPIPRAIDFIFHINLDNYEIGVSMMLVIPDAAYNFFNILTRGIAGLSPSGTQLGADALIYPNFIQVAASRLFYPFGDEGATLSVQWGSGLRPVRQDGIPVYGTMSFSQLLMNQRIRIKKVEFITPEGTIQMFDPANVNSINSFHFNAMKINGTGTIYDQYGTTLAMKNTPSISNMSDGNRNVYNSPWEADTDFWGTGDTAFTLAMPVSNEALGTSGVTGQKITSVRLRMTFDEVAGRPISNYSRDLEKDEKESYTPYDENCAPRSNMSLSNRGKAGKKDTVSTPQIILP